MEEIKRKVEFDNPNIKLQAINRLLHLIEKKKTNSEPISKSTPEIHELEYLWELAEYSCPIVRNGACRALVSLTLNGHAEFSYILEGMLNRIPTAKSFNGYMMALSDLTIIQSTINSPDGISYQNRLSQHPLVTVLKQCNSCWPYLLEQIKYLLGTEENRGKTFDAIFPFLQYVLWDCSRPSSLSVMRISLWKLLVQLYNHSHDSILKEMLFQSIQWLKLDTCLDLQEALEFLQILSYSSFQNNSNEINVLVITLSTVCLQMMRLDIDPSSGLQTLLRLLQLISEEQICSIVRDASALLISLMLELSISKQQLGLIKLVEILVSSGLVSTLIHASFLMPLLQVIASPVTFTSVLDNKPSSQQRAANLIRSIEKNLDSHAKNDKWEEGIVHSDSFNIEILHPSTSYAIQSARVIQKMQLTPYITYQWLENLEPHVNSVKYEWKFLSHIVAGIIMHGLQHKQIVRKAISIFVALARADPQQAPNMFPLLLHKLSIETDIDLRLDILHSLPEMATHKMCVGPVLQTLQILSSTPSLQALAIRLTSKLWQIQDRVFPFLHHLILEPEEKKNDGIGFDVLVAKAASIKDICETKPHQYGAELLSSLSSLLARNLKDSGSVPSVLALDGIIMLCKSEVIDLHTTWKVLSAKLSKDSRPHVVRKLCELLSLATEVEVNNLDYENFKSEIVTYLWKQVNANKSPVIVGAAYRALAAFKPENYKLKHLPEKAREGLRLPKNMVSTPFEQAKKPEDVLTYIPGSCFIKLLSSVDEQVLQDYNHFLNLQIKEEVKDMPRGVYHSTWRLNKVTQSNKTLAAIPSLLANKHEYNKIPGLQGSLAGGVLLSFEPPVEYGKNDQPLRRSFATQARAYQQKLEVLLNEVPIGAAEWQRSLALSQAWSSYMERTYFVSVEGRRAELEMQKQHGTLAGGPEEYDKLTSNAWLWARDRIADILKSGAKGKASAQGNAILAFGALAAAVSKYVSTVDDDHPKRNTSDTGEHLGHEYWISLAFETIMSVIDPARPSKSRIFTWFQGSEKGGTSLSMLVRACAAVSVAQMAPSMTSSSIEKTAEVTEKLMTMLKKSDSPAIQLYAGLGIGLYMAHLYQNHFPDSGGIEAQNLLTRTMKEFLQYALNGDLDSKVGSVLGLTAATCAMCFDPNPETRLYSSDIQSMILEKLESESHVSVIHEVLCLSLVCITAACCTMQILLMEVAENVLRKLENLLKKSPNNCGIASSLGLMIHWLQRISYPNAPEMKDHLLKIWLPTLASEAASTLARLAAVHGLCALYGLQNFLMQIPDDILELDSDVGLNELLRLMSEIVSVSKDIGMQNCCAWMLGQLYLVSSKKGNNRISLPLNYSYLNDSSILRATVDYVCESLKKQELNEIEKADRLEVCLRALSQQFPRALPPLNWVVILTPFISCGNNENLVNLSITTAINQCSSSVAAASVITTCIYGPFFTTLPLESQSIILKGLPQLLKSISSNKLHNFFHTEIQALFQSLERKDLTMDVLHGLKNCMEILDLQPDKKLLLYETVENIYLNLQFLDKKMKSIYCECLMNLPEEILERMTTIKDLADAEEIEMALYVGTYLVMQEKCPLLFLNNIIDSLATSGSSVDLECVFDCFQSLSDSKKDACMEWIFRIMGQSKNVMEWKSNLQLNDTDHMSQALNCYIDVFVVAIVGTSSKLISFPSPFYPNNLSVKFELLPVALHALLHQQANESMTSKIVDWIIIMCESPFLTSPRKQYLQASLCELRHMDELKKNTTWARTISLCNKLH